MDNYDKEKKKIFRHIRYVYSKDYKNNVYCFGDNEPSSETITMSINELIELKMALESLTEVENMIIQNNIVGNETLEFISKRLNLSLATVKRKKKEALKS